jgi:hypothetical protein
MFGTTWDHNILKKYVILFGTLFNNISIYRKNTAGSTIQTIKIPLSYGPKDKFLARADGDPNFDRQIATVLPRMSFEMLSFNYDADRKLNTLNKRYKQSGNDLKYSYQPVPYNITFNLYVMVKNAEDGTKIIEQILPYFRPEWTTTVELLSDIDGVYDIPLIINSINSEDLYEGSFTTRRAIVWTLSFTMKGYIFGPVKNSTIIRFVEATTKIATGDDIVSNTYANSVIISLKPGLTANGVATSNAATSISYLSINADDDYGFITAFTENE